MRNSITLDNISKSYNGVEVLHSVSIAFEYGKIHALVGENGAGKSTAMKIIAGIQEPSLGKVYKDGLEIDVFTPREAMKRKIALIHQELSYVSELTVAENIFLGKEPRKRMFIDYDMMYKKADAIFESLGIKIDSREKMGQLRQANKQLVEIAKAVAFDAEVIIMDEPTSSLSYHEIEKLFQIMKTLIWQERSIVFISHKIDEIYEMADIVTIIRDGTLIGTWNINQLSRERLILHMVGRPLEEIYPKRTSKIGKVYFEVKNLTKKNEFKDISFSVNRGEILGVAGLVGAGRTETMQSIFGINKRDSGDIMLNGEKVNINSPYDAASKGISYVPEDRKEMGLILIQSISHNISLPSINDIAKKYYGISSLIEKKLVEKQIKLMHIKTDNIKRKVSSLSGGNQQKVVLGKWLAKEPKLLILDEPTKGIDQGAKHEIYSIMNEYVNHGKSIIMVSSDLPELIGMADRIVVFNHGTISGFVDKKDFSQEVIMNYATSGVGGIEYAVQIE